MTRYKVEDLKLEARLVGNYTVPLEGNENIFKNKGTPAPN